MSIIHCGFIRSRIELFRDHSERIKKYSNIDNSLLRKTLKFFDSMGWFISHPNKMILPKQYFSYLEMPVTTNCTLRCKNCANLIQYYGHKPFVSSDILIDDLKKLLLGIEYIDHFKIVGGEPFLYPELSVILKFLLDSNKIGNIIIYTNGTIFPNSELQKILENKRINIFLSDYTTYSIKKDAWLTLSNINLEPVEADSYWMNFGKPQKRNASIPELRKQFSNCNSGCYSFFNGNVYICPRSGHGADLGIFKNRENEYANIRNAKSTLQCCRELMKVKHLDYATACDYCNKGTDLFVPIKAAEQAKEKMEFRGGGNHVHTISIW